MVTATRCSSIAAVCELRSRRTTGSRWIPRVMRSLLRSARASDAVAAAEDAQRALADGPIRVRMGLHTGEPRLSEEGYVGLDVHRGARIAAVGHGGQVLLSSTTRALVDADVRDLGPHRLKDLSSPEQIFQLEVDGLPSDFPLLKTLEVGMRSLPSPGTSFVGRATELEAIDGLLEDPECRLLTLVGPRRSRQDAARARGSGTADRALPARRALRAARLRAGAGAPRAGRRRSDPLPPERLLGAGAAARLPERALDPARARQLRAPGGRLRPARRTDRASPGSRAPHHLARTTQRTKRMGVRRRRARTHGEHRRRGRCAPALCRAGSAGETGVRPRREGAPAGAPHLPARSGHAARHRARRRVGVDALLRGDRRRDRAERRLPGHLDAGRARAASKPPRRIRPVVAAPLRRAARRLRAAVGLPRRLRPRRGESGHRRRPPSADRARFEVAHPPSRLRPLRPARAAAPVRGGEARRRIGRRLRIDTRTSCAPLLGDTLGAPGGADGAGDDGRAGRVARRARQPPRGSSSGSSERTTSRRR